MVGLFRSVNVCTDISVWPPPFKVILVCDLSSSCTIVPSVLYLYMLWWFQCVSLPSVWYPVYSGDFSVYPHLQCGSHSWWFQCATYLQCGTLSIMVISVSDLPSVWYPVCYGDFSVYPYLQCGTMSVMVISVWYSVCYGDSVCDLHSL